MKYIQLFKIPILCFFFVLLESSGRFGKTPNAFIFSLNNSERLAPFVSKVMIKRTEYAIQGDSSWGPKFGDDLHIYLDGKTFSKAHLGRIYSAPASVNSKNRILDGNAGVFSPDQVEVFYLDSSR